MTDTRKDLEEANHKLYKTVNKLSEKLNVRQKEIKELRRRVLKLQKGRHVLLAACQNAYRRINTIKGQCDSDNLLAAINEAKKRKYQ